MDADRKSKKCLQIKLDNPIPHQQEIDMLECIHREQSSICPLNLLQFSGVFPFFPFFLFCSSDDSSQLCFVFFQTIFVFL